MGLDYYRVLFISKNAPEQEVKQGYKKMALLHHPIRQKVERPVSPTLRAREQQIREQQRQLDSIQMFHIVSEAYDVLGDPVRRAIYDLYGEKGLKEGLPGPDGFIPPYAYHGDPHRTFKDFFGTDNPFADLLASGCVAIDFFSGTGTEGSSVFKAKEPPIYRDLWLTLEDLYNGCLKKVMIFKKMLIGEGNTVEIQEKVLTIDIRPGTPDKSQFTFPNEGDHGPNIQPADVIFITKIHKHPIYTRDGNNLIYNTTVNLCESLTGLVLPIVALDKRKFNIAIVHIIRPGYEKIVVNEGFPIYDQKEQKGDLLIRFTVKYPNTLTQNQKKMTKEALDCGSTSKYTCYTKRVPETMTSPLTCACPPIDDENINDEFKNKIGPIAIDTIPSNFLIPGVTTTSPGGPGITPSGVSIGGITPAG